MAEVAHRKVEEIDAIGGVLPGIQMHRVAADLDVGAFGISIIEMEPNADAYPEHDHSPTGAGGEMFAKRPQQLHQEEVYVALRGSGTLLADGEEYPLDPDHIAKVPPEVTRKVIAGPQGLRLLALGGTVGQAYLSGGTL
jgi:mannose-6-phosphate isomerase-like protein (cupin superfamily)